MPIPFEKLTYKDILHHQAAYDCFDKAGKSLFPDWDILGFEKAVLGCGESCYLQMANEIRKIPNLFGDWDKTMPFLRFREQGQHYGYELFLSPPKFWGSRGAPLWWAYAARQFTYDKLPMDEQFFYNKYKGIAREFGLRITSNQYIYIERFAAGGMSSGEVGCEFVREGWYDVRRRNRLYQSDIALPQKLYLEKVKERIAWYCESTEALDYVLNPALDDDSFIFAFEDAGLNEHQREIISQLWGLYTGEPMSRKEAAEKHGVSYSRVRQIEICCLRHMLQNKNRDNLIMEEQEQERS